MKFLRSFVYFLLLSWLCSFALFYLLSTGLGLSNISFLITSLLFILALFIYLYFSIIKKLIRLKRNLSLLPNSNPHNTDIDSIIKKTKKLIEYYQLNINDGDTLESKLIQLTNYDKITSLPNLNLFSEIAKKSFSNAKRNNKIIAVLLIQIHSTNPLDKGLVDLKQQLSKDYKRLLRGEDILAKYNKHTYILMLNDIKHAKLVSVVANKILKITKNLTHQTNLKESLYASIAIAIYPTDGDSFETILSKLETFASRNSKKSNFAYLTSEMTAQANEYLQLEGSLRDAIKNNELELYFQPQLNLHRSKINRVEVLLRWRHTQLGLIQPDKFISFAEESGLILALGEWVLNEACRISKAWQSQGFEPITVCVNLSPIQFRDHNIANVIATAINHYELKPEYLEIEITESAIMEDLNKTVIILNDINSLGVKIAIDDFGTGYTSINYLKKFPLDVLKIDKSFMQNIPFSKHDKAIVSAIIVLAHNLGLMVVAEGVEQVEQLTFLLQQQCDLIQGDFVSKPVPEDEIILQLPKNILTN